MFWGLMVINWLLVVVIGFIGKYLHVEVPSFHPVIPYTSLHTLMTKTPQPPYSPVSVAPSLVDTHIYLGSLV